MTTTEHLLTIVAEECAEIAQRSSKALRFGLSEIQPHQTLTNAQRIIEEFDDLSEVILILQDMGLLPFGNSDHRAQKRDKVIEFLEYSRQCGTLNDSFLNL